jgi:glycosyltransferase involved in cell wall biosynthesis
MRKWTWLELPLLLRMIHRCRPDAVNIHFIGAIYHNHPMITFLPSILKRLRPKMAVVTHIEYPSGASISQAGLLARMVRKALIFLIGSRDVDWGFGGLLRDSDRLVVLSDLHRQILQRHFSTVDKKCVLIPPPPLIEMSETDNGIARGRELLGVRTGEFVIGYYGFLYPRKGIETLLETMRLMKERIEHVRLVLIGGGNEVALKAINREAYVEELHQLAVRLGVSDKVVFTGYYSSSSDQGSLFLRAADVCVLPFDDGVMLNRSSVAVAAAHGLPIITTKGEALESPFVHGRNVFLCPPCDPKSLAAAIESIMNDQGLRQRLREGALALATEWFSWDKVVERTIQTLQVGEALHASR